MAQYKYFPEYQDNYNQLYAGTESQIINQLNTYENPALTYEEMNFDKNQMVEKPSVYSQPKYIKDTKTYEKMKPISKQIRQLPTKRKQKVKTTQPVYNKTIVLSENDDLDNILKNSQFLKQNVHVPLPTQSTIQNLCKESVISTNYYSSKPQTKIDYKVDNVIYENEYENNIDTNNIVQNYPNYQNQQPYQYNYSKHQNQPNYSHHSRHQNKSYQYQNEYQTQQINQVNQVNPSYQYDYQSHHSHHSQKINQNNNISYQSIQKNQTYQIQQGYQSQQINKANHSSKSNQPNQSNYTQEAYQIQKNPQSHHTYQTFQNNENSSKNNLSKNQQQQLNQNNNNVWQNTNVQVTKFPNTTINNYNNDYQSKNAKFPNNTNDEKEYAYPGRSSRNPNLNIKQNNQNNLNNINNLNQLPKRVPNIDQNYHQSRIQMSKIPYMDVNELQGKGNNFETTKFKNINKNYIQAYFHDDDIPQPIVCEGQALLDSDIKEKKENSENSEENNSMGSSQKESGIGGPSSEKKTNNINEANNINKKSIEQNNINNNALENNQNNNMMKDIPIEKTQIMIQHPEIENKNISMFNKSAQQSATVEPNTIQNSKVERQSKIYQSKNPSLAEKSGVSQHQQSYKQSNVLEKTSNNNNNSNNISRKESGSNVNSQTMKSNMTYQQPYNQYNQSRQLNNPKTFHSQGMNYKKNNYNFNSQKALKESGEIKMSGNQSNINERPVVQIKKLNNQSSIYQNAEENNNNVNENNINQNPSKQSHISNNKYNNYNNSQNNNSNISINNYNKSKNNIDNSNYNINKSNNNYIPSVHQSKEVKGADLISSSKKMKQSDIGEYNPNPNESAMSKNFNQKIFKGERSSFPTQSYGGNINTNNIGPLNPFNSLKGSNLKMLDDKIKDSGMK